MIELPRPLALGVTLVFFGVQGVLIHTASSRPERAFGFQMFPEGSVFSFHLVREVKSASGQKKIVPIDKSGVWRAHDSQGRAISYNWFNYVHNRELMKIGVTQHASYGVSAQLFHLQAALNYLADHCEQDTETTRFGAKVTSERNGAPPVQTELWSHER